MVHLKMQSIETLMVLNIGYILLGITREREKKNKIKR